MPSRVAILVAMEREVAPLLRSWRQQGRRPARIQLPGLDAIRCGDAVVAWGGIGSSAARRAAEILIAEECPEIVVSAGFAGALTDLHAVGDIVRPGLVIDAATGERFPAARDLHAGPVLVSAGSVLSVAQKQELALTFQADAVDMEAAAVAAVARAAGVPFLAVKAMSDAVGFPMLPLDTFVTAKGKLNLLHLIGWASVRPRTWRTLAGLRSHSRKAAQALARELEIVVDAHCGREQACR